MDKITESNNQTIRMERKRATDQTCKGVLCRASPLKPLPDYKPFGSCYSPDSKSEKNLTVTKLSFLFSSKTVLFTVFR